MHEARTLFRRAALTSFAILALGLPAGAHAATVSNGGFESGLAGWTVVNQLGSGGDWYTYSGVLAPLGMAPIAAPPEGSAAASTDANAPGSKVMYQDITLEAGYSHTLNMTLYYSNLALGGFANPSPDTLDYTTPAANQQYRVEVIKPTAALTTVDPADILATALKTKAGDPTTLAPTPFVVDLSPFAGQTVRLRLAQVDDQGVLLGSADAVSITSTDATKPVLSLLKISPTKFKASRRGASVARTKTGASVSYTLSEAGVVTFAVEKATTGRKVKGKCVKAKRSNRSAKKCTRWVKQRGSFKFTSIAGVNKFKFTGRLNGKQLKPGSYRLAATPVDAAGLVGTVRTKKFKIVKK